MQHVTVYDTPSGLGGSFAVSIEREIDAEQVEVRVWYGRATGGGWQSWPEFDGARLIRRRSDLRNPRPLATETQR